VQLYLKPKKNMYSLIGKRFQLVEARIQGTGFGTRCVFENVQNISQNNIRLFGVEYYSSTVLAVSPNNKVVLPAAAAPSLSLSLVNSSNDVPIESIPVYNLVRSNVGGFITTLNGIEITLQNCFVQVTDTTGLTVGQVALFGFWYDYK
jgi:hypothetical protein